MYDEVGVNPIQAMSKAEQAEALSEAMLLLGTDLEEIASTLVSAVSEHVSPAVSDYEADTLEHIDRVSRNGMILAQEVQGAVSTVVTTDAESAELYQGSMNALDIRINF